MAIKDLGPGLVLSRKFFETILIGEDIAVTVVRIGPTAVRLHISAPDHVNIVRKEIKGRDVPIQSSPDSVADLGRKRGEFLEADEVADVFVENGMIDHGA